MFGRKRSRILPGRVRVAATLGMLAASAVAGVMASAGPAGAATEKGHVVIMNRTATAPLNSGASATVFTVVAPASAACPGDTANHEYQVNSFVEPVSRPVDQVIFGGLGTPNVGVDLKTTDGAPFVAQATAIDTGALPRVPTLSWSPYSHDPQDLPPGRYNVGLVCARPGGTATYYWSTQIDFTSSPTDPGGFTWSVVKGFRGHRGSSGNDLAAGVVLAVAVLVAAGFLLLARRGRSRPPGPTGDGRPKPTFTAGATP